MKLLRNTGILMLLLWAPAAAAQELISVLETAFVLESRLAEGTSDRYFEARSRETAALRELEAASERLDRALGDISVSLEELRRLEAQILQLREVAFARSQETAELRRELYRSMDRLGELGETIERQRNRSLVVTDELAGLWRIDVTEGEEFGVLELRLDGTLVSGTYRLSNGARGSVRGTFVNKALELERIDSVLGRDMLLQGVLNPTTGEIQGTWQRKILSEGTLPAGKWSGRKLSPEEERSLELESETED